MSVYEPLLGTVVEVRIHAADPFAAAVADARVVAEMRRLEHVFSVFDETSELCRWRRGEDFEHSTEFVELLRMALHWQVSGGGAFNPAAGVLSRAWVVAEQARPRARRGTAHRTGRVDPSPRYRVDGDRATRVGDCSSLNFNAIAKGFVVDRAVDAGMTDPAVTAITVNAGGDLCHRGEGSLAVGIENPATPYDNAAPLMVVDIANRGVATSGSSRRGFRVGGRHYSHVLDPRTGHPRRPHPFGDGDRRRRRHRRRDRDGDRRARRERWSRLRRRVGRCQLVRRRRRWHVVAQYGMDRLRARPLNRRSARRFVSYRVGSSWLNHRRRR